MKNNGKISEVYITTKCLVVKQITAIHCWTELSLFIIHRMHRVWTKMNYLETQGNGGKRTEEDFLSSNFNISKSTRQKSFFSVILHVSTSSSSTIKLGFIHMGLLHKWNILLNSEWMQLVEHKKYRQQDITMYKADIDLQANHLICIARWAPIAPSTVSNRKYTQPALFLYAKNLSLNTSYIHI